MTSLVMGPDGAAASASALSDKVPASFDGQSNYAAYREKMKVWLVLTSLPPNKQGPAVVGRLRGEAESSAMSLGIERISAIDVVNKVLEHLDKSYSIDASNQLDTDLAEFLDFRWQKSMTVEQSIAGFHVRLDRLSSLNIDEKLKSHLLLRHADLDARDRNMIVGSAAGKYEASYICSALGQAYRCPALQNDRATHNTMPTPSNCRTCKRMGKKCRRCLSNANRTSNGDQFHRPTLYTYRSHATADLTPRAIVDSGASSSVVSQETLDSA